MQDRTFLVLLFQVCLHSFVVVCHSSMEIDTVVCYQAACDAWRRRQDETSGRDNITDHNDSIDCNDRNESSDWDNNDRRDDGSDPDLPFDDRDYVGDTSGDIYYIEHGVTRQQHVQQMVQEAAEREQASCYDADTSANSICYSTPPKTAAETLAEEIEERRQSAIRRLLDRHPYLQLSSSLSVSTQIRIESNRQAALAKLAARVHTLLNPSVTL